MEKTSRYAVPWRMLIAAFAVAFVAVCLVPATAQQAHAASGTETVTLTGTDYYSDAHQVLALVNKARASNGLGALALDAELTKGAMNRAAECALYFAHTRPNGTGFQTAIPGQYRAYASENIAAGQSSPQSVMEGWLNSSAHRSSILSSSAKSVGIDVFSQGGVIYWSQIFSDKTSTSTARKTDIENTHKVVFSYALCGFDQGFNMNYADWYLSSLDVGERFKMQYCIGNSGWTQVYCVVDPACATWKSSDTSVCTVSASGVVKGVSPGTATITATLPSGKKISNEWTVGGGAKTSASSPSFTVTAPSSTGAQKPSIAGAKVSVSNKTYTGKALKSAPKVTLNGKTLVKGTDYTVMYKNNVNVGVAKVIITGKGKYSGQLTRTFKIKPKGTSIYKLSAKSKGFTVKWKTQTIKMPTGKIGGYQVRYATKSSMKNAKVKTVKGYKSYYTKISKLKAGKKYYVQVRTYKKINGATYYSSWSPKKSVRTR